MEGDDAKGRAPKGKLSFPILQEGGGGHDQVGAPALGGGIRRGSQKQKVEGQKKVEGRNKVERRIRLHFGCWRDEPLDTYDGFMEAKA